MKKIVLTISLCTAAYLSFGQLNNDLQLIKPIVNFNDSCEGFYSDYYRNELDHIFCSAIVRNVGDYDASNVFLEIKVLGYYDNILSTYFSDTIEKINVNQIDTFNIVKVSPNTWHFSLAYKIRCDSIDENASNNIDTLPRTDLWQNMWSNVSRANVSTDTLDITKIDGFQSGDFIGVTVKTSEQHELAYISVYMTEAWPDSLDMYAKLYENKRLIDSVKMFNDNMQIPWWISGLTSWVAFGAGLMQRDSTYYFGVQLVFPEGTRIPIGIDTSSFHNFEVETIAIINNSWTTMDFVPLIRLVCDPESAELFKEDNDNLIYPNPTTGIITIDIENVRRIEIYSNSGILLERIEESNWNKRINLRGYADGLYYIKVYTNVETFVNKIVKL